MRRRYLYRLVGVVLFLGVLLSTLIYVTGRGAEDRCVGVRVRVVDSAAWGFLTARRVVDHLHRYGLRAEGQQLQGIDTHRVERELSSIPSLGSVEAYVDCRGLLNIVLSQRHPLFRIMGRDGGSCYVDLDGLTFPLDVSYSAHTLVVSGRIDAPPSGVLLSDSTSEGSSLFWERLYRLVQFIDSHAEWKSLIAQVYVSSPDRVELVPRVGGFIINLGGLEHVSYKFDKLRSIYRASLPKEGLGAYSVVDLAYGDQVVCVRR